MRVYLESVLNAVSLISVTLIVLFGVLFSRLSELDIVVTGLVLANLNRETVYIDSTYYLNPYLTSENEMIVILLIIVTTGSST